MGSAGAAAAHDPLPLVELVGDLVGSLPMTKRNILFCGSMKCLQMFARCQDGSSMYVGTPRE